MKYNLISDHRLSSVCWSDSAMYQGFFS